MGLALSQLTPTPTSERFALLDESPPTFLELSKRIERLKDRDVVLKTRMDVNKGYLANLKAASDKGDYSAVLIRRIQVVDDDDSEPPVAELQAGAQSGPAPGLPGPALGPAPIPGQPQFAGDCVPIAVGEGIAALPDHHGLPPLSTKQTVRLALQVITTHIMLHELNQRDAAEVTLIANVFALIEPIESRKNAKEITKNEFVSLVYPLVATARHQIDHDRRRTSHLTVADATAKGRPDCTATNVLEWRREFIAGNGRFEEDMRGKVNRDWILDADDGRLKKN